MSGCSGNCGSCGGKQKVINIEGGRFRGKSNNYESMLNPPKKEKAKLEELTGICEHYTFGKVARSQCMNCIREWVNTVSIKEAEQLALELYKEGRKIASERIRTAIEERLWNEWRT
jgi:hypothetical protein